MDLHPDWVSLWEKHYLGIRDQVRAERAAGMGRRAGMRSHSDSAVDLYSRREADKRAQEAVIRHNEAIERLAQKGML